MELSVIIENDQLERKHVLLDTCFLIKSKEYSDTEFFDDLYALFANNLCTPVVNEFIRFEFLRGSKYSDQFIAKSDFLEQLSPKGKSVTLPITADIVSDSIPISNIYANKNIQNTQISLVDCYISSYLKKYSRDLILITLNHKDFPLVLHDRLGIYPIDTDKEIITLGFYTFNQDKFDSCYNEIYS